jgi:hypothetical protein
MQYFTQGFIIGSLFSAGLSCHLTNIYIHKYYILIPSNMSDFLETYKKMVINGRLK